VLVRDNSWSRHMAIRALGEIRDQRATDRLIALLRKGDREAASALGKIGDPRAVGALIDILVNGSGHLATAAADALGRIGDRRAVEPLMAALDREEVDESSVTEALGLIGDPSAAPKLADQITNRSAAIALRRIGSRAIPSIVRNLDDQAEDARKAAAWILA